MRLLLIEEDLNLKKSLMCILLDNHYTVDAVSDGYEGQSMAQSGIYDLIILDNIWPGKVVVKAIKTLRHQRIHTPVLMLSEKKDVLDCVESLDSGADDYLIKPFDQQELLARLRALGRRASDMWENDVLECGRMRCIPARCEILCRDEITSLTHKEMQILECLIRNKNRVVTKEQLIQRIWGYNCEVENNNLEVNLSYLRKKLKTVGTGVVIKTIRGIGYCLKEDPTNIISPNKIIT